MSEIGGKSWQECLYVGTGPVPLRQPVDGERVPQVMKPGLTRMRVAATNARKPAEPPESKVYLAVAKRVVLLGLEKR